MTPDTTDSVFLAPARKRWTFVAISSGAFVLFNLWLAATSGPGWIFVAIFFGLFAAMAISFLIPGGGGLQLDREGFSYRFFFVKERRFKWSDVGPIQAASAGVFAQVAFRLNSADPNARPELLPETYGMPAAHLAALMNQWREHALKNPAV